MTMSEERECLKYKLKGNASTEEIELWGHEYVRHLAGEVVMSIMLWKRIMMVKLRATS